MRSRPARGAHPQSGPPWRGTAVTRLAFAMHLSDVVDQLILIQFPASNWIFTPIIKATATHVQHFTHLLNREF
ncbi:hypothetical protein [Spirosoma endbachense]|uniref:hypothetical protein n=1 Tax=Spirosoma endbachense TaxID=2666025 RepID=UPI001E62AEB0|nr:hypothetical protein [Spirosoma endbachense]